MSVLQPLVMEADLPRVASCTPRRGAKVQRCMLHRRDSWAGGHEWCPEPGRGAPWTFLVRTCEPPPQTREHKCHIPHAPTKHRGGVGVRVGEIVGRRVGDLVGVNVGVAVGFAVGALVGAGVAGVGGAGVGASVQVTRDATMRDPRCLRLHAFSASNERATASRRTFIRFCARAWASAFNSRMRCTRLLCAAWWSASLPRLLLRLFFSLLLRLLFCLLLCTVVCSSVLFF